MTTISQTIPSYTGGISEQPDHLKAPGTVNDAVNVVPDLTYGLFKRLGAKRVTALPLTISSNESKWFHYYRNEKEGTFIGQIDSTGAVKMWRTKTFVDGNTTYAAGSEVPVVYSTAGTGATETSIKEYLDKDTGTVDHHSQCLQTLTLNDTTFVLNRKVATASGSATASSAPDTYYAYVELKKTENGRQYGLDIGGSGQSNESITSATKVRVTRTGPSSMDNNTGNQGHCPGVGTRVFQLGGLTSGDAPAYNSASIGKNLYFRLTTTGQQGVVGGGDDSEVNDRGDYTCTYTHKIDLYHGGSAWTKDQETTEYTLKGGTYKTTVEAIETHTADVLTNTSTAGGNASLGYAPGFVRPDPTPFDQDTATSAQTILGGLKTHIEYNNNFTATIIGNGLYITSTAAFTVRVLESDLMRVITDSTNDVSNLPTQCKNDYRVLVSNSQASQEDDYYLKFEGTGGYDGPGKWVETTKGGIKNTIDPTTMPHTIKRTAVNQFTVGQFTDSDDESAWTDRYVGDNVTNPKPSFITTNASGPRYISQLSFFRNRLVLLSGSNISLSAPNDLGNFWRETALIVGPNDGISINTSQETPANLTNAIEINAGLVLFSQNEQFLLSTDDSILNPDTAKTSHLSSYYNNKYAGPISLGTTLGFIDDSGRNSRFMEMGQIQAGTEPFVYEHSKVVPRLMDNDLDIFQVSRDNSIIFIGKAGSDTVYGYRWYQVGEQRLLSSWFKWKFAKPIRYFFVTDDSFYFVDQNTDTSVNPTKTFLQRINFIASDEDLSTTQDSTVYDMHLDNWVSKDGGTYTSTTNTTAFSASTWLPYTEAGVNNAKLVMVDSTGRYAECTIAENDEDWTVPGDWTSGTRYVGYLYDMEVDFPKLYPSKAVGNKTVSDINASLVLHRLKLALGRVGVYESTLNRTGKDAYTELYESTPADAYEAGNVPYLLEEIRTIPVYDKNTNTTLTVKSSHPSPATIRSLAWEGDYTTKYRRV